MERINQFTYYELGKSLKQIIDRRGSAPTTELLWELMPAERFINGLLRGEPMPLGLSRKSAEAVSKEITYLMDSHFRAETADGKKVLRFPSETDPHVEEWELIGLREALTAFETVFREELSEAATWSAPHFTGQAAGWVKH